MSKCHLKPSMGNSISNTKIERIIEIMLNSNKAVTTSSHSRIQIATANSERLIKPLSNLTNIGCEEKIRISLNVLP